MSMTSTIQTRRPHKKVRTGCLTCKARRKKCDEARPACQRCSTAGFKCEGYPDVITTRSGRDTGPVKVLTLAQSPASSFATLSPNIPTLSASQTDEDTLDSISLTRSPNALSDLSQIADLEVHCYSYFRQNTVPRLATYFENCTWRIDLQNAALAVHHPVLFHAVAALGAVHRRFCYGISREAFEYCAHADNLYKKATASLKAYKQSREGQMDITDHYVVSASEVLLSIFQAFQADSQSSSKHIHAAIKHSIGQPLQLLHSESWYYKAPSPSRVICGLMYQINSKVTELFNEPAVNRSPDYDPSYRSRAILYAFSNLREMKKDLFSIVEDVWCRDRYAALIPSARRVILETFEDHLDEWIQASLRSLDHIVIEPEEVQAFNLLSLAHSTLCISIQGNMFTTDRPSKKRLAHLPVLRGIGNDFSEAAAELCQAIDHMQSIEVADLSEVKWMFQQTIRKYNIFQFENKPMMESNSQVDEVLNLWTIAKNVSEAEEQAVIQALRNVIPPHATNVDIADVWREKRKVAVRYFEPDPQQGFKMGTTILVFLNSIRA